MIIGKHDSETPELSMNYQIVDFTLLYSVPLEFLKAFSERKGKRLQMKTPHRELLSQHFGNFFSRIGLPNEDHINKDEVKKVIREFEKQGS